MKLKIAGKWSGYDCFGCKSSGEMGREANYSDKFFHHARMYEAEAPRFVEDRQNSFAIAPSRKEMCIKRFWCNRYRLEASAICGNISSWSEMVVAN